MNLEEVVLHLVRLGLKGDVSSVGQYAKRLLRDLARHGASHKMREALAELVASVPTTTMRFVEPVASEVDLALVTVEAPGDAEEPILDRMVAVQIEDVLREHERASELEAVGLHPTRTLLFTGPPGVGKTITARAIASRMGVPLFRVDLSTMMSSYLGKSAQNLRAALSQARTVPSVMLLDEFDAIGKRRDDPADVGELKRIVNVLLLELEAWPVGLLIAATNHAELLDRALWRRFERVLCFGLPSDEARREMIMRQFKRHGREISANMLNACVIATAQTSGSELSTFVRSVIRRAVLSQDANIDHVLATAIIDRLVGLARENVDARRLFCELCNRELGMTQREIAPYLGISHVAVGKILRTSRNNELHLRKAKVKANHV